MESEQLKKLDEEIKKDISKLTSKIENIGTNIENKISSKLPRNNDTNVSREDRRHANLNLFMLVVFAGAVFLSAAFIYHFQLSFFYNKLVDKSAELDNMESKLTQHLSRINDSQDELSAKAKYEQDLINKYSETQGSTADLENQIKILSDTIVQIQNRVIIETKTFNDCNTERGLLLDQNQKLKDKLLDTVDFRNQVKAECDDACGDPAMCPLEN